MLRLMVVLLVIGSGAGIWYLSQAAPEVGSQGRLIVNPYVTNQPASSTEATPFSSNTNWLPWVAAAAAGFLAVTAIAAGLNHARRAPDTPFVYYVPTGCGSDGGAAEASDDSSSELCEAATTGDD